MPVRDDIRNIETGAKTEDRDIQTALDELAALDTEVRRMDEELEGIFTKLGYRWGGAA